MFRKLHLFPLVVLAATAVQGATLQQLSMDQMTDLATSVVRAKVTGASAAVSSASGAPTIYTHYKLAVSEIWKGEALSEVSMPGGTANGQHQEFPGVPELKIGSEYVLFLWKSPRTGTVQTLGLTQGIFDVTKETDGSLIASRRQSGELMVDAAGRRVTDRAVRLKLARIKARVRRASEATR
jgi:hypothetical protein